jgi:hypothetical protein
MMFCTIADFQIKLEVKRRPAKSTTPAEPVSQPSSTGACTMRFFRHTDYFTAARLLGV